MDLDRVANATNVDGKGDEAGFNLTFQLGALSSALEYSIPEQMFVTEENPGEGVSAVKALQKASAQGQRIYHITPANQAGALPNIHHSSETMNEIRQALAVGKEVITHTDSISVPGWSGAGYVIYDPEMGSGAWKIGGGMNGGWSDILSTIADILVYLHAEIDQGLLKLSKLVSKITSVGAFASAVGTFLKLKDDCGIGVSMAIASLLTIFNSLASSVALGIAFANAPILIVGILVVVFISSVINLINLAITDYATRICRLSVIRIFKYEFPYKYLRSQHGEKETLVS